MSDTPWSTALVTGASSGIGRQFARTLAARGSDLVVVARREKRLTELRDELEDAHDGVDVEVLPADLIDSDELGQVEERLADTARPVDLLVNNAGFGTYGAFLDQDVEEEDAEVQLNVRAILRLTHAALPGMVDRANGAVLNVASVAGLQPIAFNATYSATKAFVTTFSEAIHEELRSTGVTVCALCPGFVRTEFQESADVTEDGIPDFAWIDPEDLVNSALADLEAGKAVSIPGLGYKLLGIMSKASPRWAVRRIAGQVGRLS